LQNLFELTFSSLFLILFPTFLFFNQTATGTVVTSPTFGRNSFPTKIKEIGMPSTHAFSPWEFALSSATKLFQELYTLLYNNNNNNKNN
jgi:hypothetical protein